MELIVSVDHIASEEEKAIAKQYWWLNSTKDDFEYRVEWIAKSERLSENNIQQIGHRAEVKYKNLKRDCTCGRKIEYDIKNRTEFKTIYKKLNDKTAEFPFDENQCKQCNKISEQKYFNEKRTVNHIQSQIRIEKSFEPVQVIKLERNKHEPKGSNGPLFIGSISGQEFGNISLLETYIYKAYFDRDSNILSIYIGKEIETEIDPFEKFYK